MPDDVQREEFINQSIVLLWVVSTRS